MTRNAPNGATCRDRHFLLVEIASQSRRSHRLTELAEQLGVPVVTAEEWAYMQVIGYAEAV